MSLFGALNSSVTGLQAQSDALGIISDNISNVNTTGYKANKANFQSLVTAAATQTSFNPGGVQLRPTQEVGAQGILNGSDISTDLAIEGNGMFAVKDAVGNVDANELLYTRAGNFRVDDNGDLRNANGFLLQGWRLQDDGNGNLEPPADKDNPGSLETVNVDGFSGIARATSNIELGANLPPNLNVSETRQATSRIFDGEGTPHNLQFEFSRNDGSGNELGPNQYRVDIHAPTLSDDPNNPQSGLFDLGGSELDVSTIAIPNANAGNLGAALGGAAGTDFSQISNSTVDFDGDGTADARETIYDILDAGGNAVQRVRLLDTETTPVPAGPLGLTTANMIQFDVDGDNQFDAGNDVTLANSTGVDLTAAAANGGADRTSRLSTVVQFDGNGGIQRFGTTALNDNLFGGGTANEGLSAITAINANTSGRLDLPLNFTRADGLNPSGTDASQPTQISVDIGTPQDVDTSGNGVIEPPEQGVNDFATDGLQSFVNQPDFQLNALEQDGLQFGDFTGVDVGEDGIVTAQFSNGERREVFQIPVVTFNNPNGLESRTGTVFRESTESGEALLAEAGIGGAGTIAPSALEGSTVDLATEFTKMIETQRAYSASTRVVTASDEMLQEITNATR
jgi:flagellar hook protein FlgE